MIAKKLLVGIILLYPLLIFGQQSQDSNIKENAGASHKYHNEDSYENDETMLETIAKPITDKIFVIQNNIREENILLQVQSDTSTINKANKNIDSLINKLDQLDAQLRTIQFRFIRNNPSSFFSLDRLSMLLKRSDGSHLYVDTVKLLFNMLDRDIKNSKSGKHFNLLLKNFKNSKVGSLAPDFTLNDINNQPVSLASFRNKSFVLLDFWASWCVPCREDMPKLNLLFRRLHRKGLEIIGLSKDDERTQWKKAIAKEGIQNWEHILAPFSMQKIDSIVTNKYFVYSIPVKILINKDGIIIGRWSGSSDKSMNELEKLLDNVF